MSLSDFRFALRSLSRARGFTMTLAGREGGWIRTALRARTPGWARPTGP